MCYKTVLVHVDKSINARQRFQLAAAIAENEDAYLVGAAMTGVSRFIYQPRPTNAADREPTEFLQAPVGFLRERAGEALAHFEDVVRMRNVRFERRLIDDETASGMSLLARYSDLVVVGQANRNDPCSMAIPDLPEYIALASGRPVLIVPYSDPPDNTGSRALVAWDGSISATRAIANALPLLRRAQIVQVAIFNPDSTHGVHGDEPGADIALYLARQGVKVDVMLQQTSADIGDALLSLAAELGSELIVMGCYGHTRFREILLGGATRSVLEAMTVPVLMSH